MRHPLLFLLLPLALFAGQAHGQTAGSIQFPSGYAPGQAPCTAQTDGTCAPVSAATPLPVSGKQESLSLASANSAAAGTAVYGGDYVFSQSCLTYGSVALQAVGPDGATYQTLVARSAADSTGGTGITFGSNAMVRVALTGTTGCNATLSRVP